MNDQDPLTPPDSDLRDFQFMPLDVVRFAQSDLVALEEPASVVAAILLWGASWHGRPAGSLTDDDRSLSKAAGYGRAVSEWLTVKEGAMRGWVKCSDGRLYHPVVAEKVIEAWTGKLRQRHRTYLAAIRKHNERDKEKGGNDQRTSPSFEEWIANARPQTVVTRDNPPQSRVTKPDVTQTSTEVKEPVTRSGPACHAKNASKGQGQGQGHPIDIGTSSLMSDPAPAAANNDAKTSTALVLSGEPAPAKRGKAKAEPTPTEQAEFDAFWAVYPRKAGKQDALSAYVAALRSGARPEDIFVGAQGYAGQREGQDPIHTKMAQGWLNGRRWTDEIAEPPQGGYRDQRGGGGWDPMQQAIDGIDFSKEFAA